MTLKVKFELVNLTAAGTNLNQQCLTLVPHPVAGERELSCSEKSKSL